MDNSNRKKLCEAFLLLEDSKEVCDFLRDLCTPQEMKVLAERWQICRLLAEENMSYRKIQDITGSSLTTIGRVARFLRQEPYKGYQTVLKRIQNGNTHKLDFFDTSFRKNTKKTALHLRSHGGLRMDLTKEWTKKSAF